MKSNSHIFSVLINMPSISDFKVKIKNYKSVNYASCYEFLNVGMHLIYLLHSYHIEFVN